MVTRRNLCSIALAGLFPLAVSAADKKPRIAVVYVSRTGHTRSVAEAVRSMTGADLFHIETVEPYPDEYRATTEVVKEEIEKNVKRPIKPLGINLDQYDVVILGTPTWWHRPAQPLKTWMETVDLTKKFVLTMSTHGGGGLMEVRSEFESLLPGVKLGTHFLSYGGVSRTDPDVRDWLRENKLL